MGNNMIKKILSIMMALFCLFIVGCNNNDVQSGSNSETNSETQSGNDSTPEDETLEVCSIEYKYWDAKTQSVKEVPDFMWVVEGVYPNEYKEGTETTVDSLRNYRKDADNIYAFDGWYYDVEYKNKLEDNKVAASIREDIILYAKIVERAKVEGDVVTATISYCWKDFDGLQEGVESFPVGMIEEDFIFPTEYIEGEEVQLPELKKWKQTSKIIYEFDGWYYDVNQKQKIADGLISKNQTGNLIVYAAITVWVG